MARKADGFSLIELLIAMVVTLLVSGAVFGLLTAGQSAFRREPQLIERQQSLRQAMTLIQADVMRAGSGLPPFVQAFTNGLNATGTRQGSLGVGPTDALEILAGDPSCPPATACAPPFGPSAGTANDIGVYAPPGACVQASVPGFFGFFDDTGVNFAVQPVTAVAAVAGCPSRQITAGARVPGTQIGGPFAATGYAPVQLVRYEIADCLAPDAGIPCLYRSTTGLSDRNGVVVGPAPGPAGNTTWQVVARGIEDLQVGYRNGPNLGGAPPAPNDNPGVILPCLVAPPAPCGVPASYDSLVTQVQVTLVARTVAGGLQGQTTSAAGPARVRGQLTGVFTPRTALAVLSQEPPNPRWR